MNIRKIIKEEIDDLQWIKDVEFFHDIENYVGKPLKLTDHYRIDQFGYRIERTEESPEAYNICWDEVIKDNEGAEMVHKVWHKIQVLNNNSDV